MATSRRGRGCGRGREGKRFGRVSQMAQGCEGRVAVAEGETHRRSGDQASATAGKSGCPECCQAQCGTHTQRGQGWARTLAGAQIVQPGCPGVLRCRTARGKFSRVWYLGRYLASPGTSRHGLARMQAVRSLQSTVAGERIGNVRVHVPSNSGPRAPGNKNKIPDSCPHVLMSTLSAAASYLGTLDRGTMQHGWLAWQHWAHHSDLLLRTMLPSTLLTSDRKPKQGGQRQATRTTHG